MSVIETAGGSLPRLGLGTWQLSGEECSRVVAEALDAGYRHIDTAAMYDNEAAVGAGLRQASVDRGDIFVTTKVWYDQIGDGDLQRSAEASLSRLGLDYVDLLLIHWPNPGIPLAESIGALCDAKARGLAKAIGVSNFPSDLLRRAVAFASEPLACNQVEYHPFLRQEKLLESCRAHDMALTAYAPIARGRVNDDPLIRDIAAERGLTPAQVTIAWLLGQENVAAIPKTSSRARLVENLAGSKVVLSDAEMARITALGTASGRTVNPGWSPQWDSA